MRPRSSHPFTHETHWYRYIFCWIRINFLQNNINAWERWRVCFRERWAALMKWVLYNEKNCKRIGSGLDRNASSVSEKVSGKGFSPSKLMREEWPSHWMKPCEKWDSVHPFRWEAAASHKTKGGHAAVGLDLRGWKLMRSWPYVCDSSVCRLRRQAGLSVQQPPPYIN